MNFYDMLRMSEILWLNGIWVQSHVFSELQDSIGLGFCGKNQMMDRFSCCLSICNYVILPKNPDPSKQMAIWRTRTPAFFRFKPLDWMVQWFLDTITIHLIHSICRPRYAQMPQRTVMGWMEELVLMALRILKNLLSQTFWLGSVPSKLLQHRKKI